MKTLLKNIMPFDLFKRMLDEGYVRTQVHPQYPELMILGYTEAAQFDRMWNEATNACRGLIVRLNVGVLDEDAEVLARPFAKFHNLNTEYAPETMEANLPAEAPLVTTKLDGSMGILYKYDGKAWVATRGSFDSDQARWATQWYRSHGTVVPSWPDGVTPVCEVIFSTNRIVVDYDFEGLVLLSIINNETGEELSRFDVEMWGAINEIKVVSKFDKTLAECAVENTPNEEGYVLTYSNGVKVKVKFNEYVRLHRILTGLNPKTVWEMLATGQNVAINNLLNDPKMPATFTAWLSEVMTILEARYAEIEAEAKIVFANRPESAVRKDQALYFKQTPQLAGLLFQMLDGKSYAKTIWDRIEPKGNQTFKKEGE